jgi:DNA-binding response OmpR family regulator
MLKVLIVEDALMMADMVEEVLVQNGYEVCGVAPTVAEAVILGRRHKPDLAIIDMRLADGGLGTDIGTQLAGLDRPGILYVTGNISQVMQTATVGDACLPKPYRDLDLLRSLEIVAEIVATGKASPPFPRGFQVLASAPMAHTEASHE